MLRSSRHLQLDLTALPLGTQLLRTPAAQQWLSELSNYTASPQLYGKFPALANGEADIDGDGHITLEQFVVISEKFPNILFPPNVGGE